MQNRTLAIYHYFEKDRTYIENFFHFLRFGYDKSIDCIVVIAGEYSISLPQFENLIYLFTENKNNDYGGYSVALKTMVEVDAYDFFIFINSSVRGPFVPSYMQGRWTDGFIKLLTDDVGLVGSAINILPTSTIPSMIYKEKYGGDGPFSHVESTAYAMPKRTLRHLLARGFYDQDRPLSKDEVIRDYEIRLSQEILAAGWNIKCLLSEYNAVDYRLPHQDINPTSKNGDPACGYSYFGRTAHPYEALFIKTNRELFTPQYLDRLSYSLLGRTPTPLTLEGNPTYVQYVAHLNQAKTTTEQVIIIPPKSKLRFVPKPLRPLFLSIGHLIK